MYLGISLDNFSTLGGRLPVGTKSVVINMKSKAIFKTKMPYIWTVENQLCSLNYFNFCLPFMSVKGLWFVKLNKFYEVILCLTSKLFKKALLWIWEGLLIVLYKSILDFFYILKGSCVGKLQLAVLTKSVSISSKALRVMALVLWRRHEKVAMVSISAALP